MNAEKQKASGSTTIIKEKRVKRKVEFLKVQTKDTQEKNRSR